ncbi:hypothetical protein Scel_88300 [Streptomyces cellostaticus]|nr:hypothetical protein Scel_88300 [Streptomyces cellostaticus]
MQDTLGHEVGVDVDQPGKTEPAPETADLTGFLAPSHAGGTHLEPPLSNNLQLPQGRELLDEPMVPCCPTSTVAAPGTCAVVLTAIDAVIQTLGPTSTER